MAAKGGDSKFFDLLGAPRELRDNICDFYTPDVSNAMTITDEIEDDYHLHIQGKPKVAALLVNKQFAFELKQRSQLRNRVIVEDHGRIGRRPRRSRISRFAGSWKCLQCDLTGASSNISGPTDFVIHEAMSSETLRQMPAVEQFNVDIYVRNKIPSLFPAWVQGFRRMVKNLPKGKVTRLKVFLIPPNGAKRMTQVYGIMGGIHLEINIVARQGSYARAHTGRTDKRACGTRSGVTDLVVTCRLSI